MNVNESFHSYTERKVLSERQNAVELYLDEKDFKMKLNGVEVHRVKGFSIQCDAGHPLADMTLNISVDKLKLG